MSCQKDVILGRTNGAIRRPHLAAVRMLADTTICGVLERKTTALKIDDPLDEATDIGTIIDSKQFTKVDSVCRVGRILDAARNASSRRLVA